MQKILRNPIGAAETTYDLIIIGGGIYGAMLALEASRRDLRPLLIERNDFGEFTSFNSLRIIHGGFRYLQNLDFSRLLESVGERRWFLQNFPDLVKPFPCLMPLYGQGLRRSSILRIALLVYEFLARKRNIGLPLGSHILTGRVIDAIETKRLFPLVDTDGLEGGAVWYDAFMPDSQRLLMEILRLANENDATVLNYVEAKELMKVDNVVSGITAIDHENGRYYHFKSNIVINASGPWCREVAYNFDRDYPSLFKSMVAWNILFNRKALAKHGLAVSPKNHGKRAYFIVPWKGMLFAGTGHAQWLKDEKTPMPTGEQIQNFIDDINCAIPTLNLHKTDILQIFPGLQSANKEGGTDFSTKDVLINHKKNNGPDGLFSISGVKFTTSRLVAEKTLDKIFPYKKTCNTNRNKAFRITPNKKRNGIFEFDWNPDTDDSKWKDSLRSIVTSESVLHIDDLIFRRTSLGINPSRVLKVAQLTRELFDWDDNRFNSEVNRLKDRLSEYKYPL